MRATFAMLDYVPIGFITAKGGKNVGRLLNLAQNLHKQASERMTTGDLNKVIQRAYKLQPPPSRQNRQGKIFYATQVATNPPTIVLFANAPELFDPVYHRYLIKYLRDHSAFRDVPIKLQFRAKNRQSGEEEDANKAAGLGAKKLDLSGLEFRSQVTEEELDRAKKRKDGGLWEI
jgi:GTP-binding protein